MTNNSKQHQFDYDRGFSAGEAERVTLQQRLTAAEQRNAILAGVLPILKMVKGDGLHVFLNSSERAALESALKPTESGASEPVEPVTANSFWPADSAEELADFKDWLKNRKQANEH